MSALPAHASRRRAANSCVVAMVLWLVPFAGAQAVVRCIDSDVQVQATFDAALASAETLEEVRIKQGNFFFNTGQFGYFGVLEGSNKTLLISGGWSGVPGQCTTQDGVASSTLFWGLNQRRVFGINASTTFTGSIVIENMSFGGGFASGSSSASCLALGEQNGGVMGIRVDRVRVESCASSTDFDAPAMSLVSSSALILRNSVVAGNDAGVSLPVSVGLRGGVGYVLNNTIASNTSANVNGFVGISAGASNGATLTLANNLFDGNVATAAPRTDIRLAAGVSLLNNRFTGLSGFPVANTGSSTGPAGFSGNDFELSSSSTARDAGAFFVPILQGNFDLAGLSRVQGSAVDLGALEFPIVFHDGFESP